MDVVSNLVHLSDLPFIAIVAVGILLPELYIRLKFSYRVLVTIRMATLFGTCALAAYANHLLYPTSDPAVYFTRAFIFIGISRFVMVTSHYMAQERTKKQEDV